MLLSGSGLPPGSPFRVGGAAGGQPDALLAPSSERREHRSASLAESSTCSPCSSSPHKGHCLCGVPICVWEIPRRGQIVLLVTSPLCGLLRRFGITSPLLPEKPTQGQHRPHRVARDASAESYKARIHASLASLRSRAESRKLLPNADHCCGGCERSSPVPAANTASGSSSASFLSRTYSDLRVR